MKTATPMPSPAHATPIFLDFEASGLGRDSWPIEVGLAWITPAGNIESAARLIAPHPSWPEHGWSTESAKIHGIPLETLHVAGLPAREVAAWCATALDGRQALCDAPEFDGMWMKRLLATLPRQAGQTSPAQLPPRPAHWQEALISRMPGEVEYDRALRRADALGARLPVPHRAEQDAARLAQLWRATTPAS